MKNEIIKRYMKFAPLAVLLGAWEILVRGGVADPFFVSSPSAIIREGYKVIASGEMIPHLVASLGAVLGALAIALVVGIATGIAAGFYKKIGMVAGPYLFAANALPIIAITPIIILWFGFGLVAKTLIIFLMAVIPIIIAAMDGAMSVDRELLVMARLFGANDKTIIRSIVLWHAAPFIYSGARIAVGRAFIGLVVAEIFGYNKGLGYLIALYSANYQTALLMTTVIVLLACNIALVKLVALIEKKHIQWK